MCECGHAEDEHSHFGGGFCLQCDRDKGDNPLPACWMFRAVPPRIFVPYTRLRPWTQTALADYAYETVPVEGDDGYCWYFVQRWRLREDFITCEHDVVPWDGALESLWSCPEEWCAFGYMDDPNPAPVLGLAKFRESFMTALPDVWTDLIHEEAEPWSRTRWAWCDTWLARYAEERGHVCHVHSPGVENRHR